VNINDADAVRREFAQRFDANGACRTCGARPDHPGAAVLERAVWYAEHSCENVGALRRKKVNR
jgi:hypothetical protein